MISIKAIFRYITNFFKGASKVEIKQLQRLNKFDTVLIKSTREASDNLLAPGTILIVRDGEMNKWVRFICPCGCGQKQVISLQSSHYPHWSVFENRGIITVNPSVDVNGQDGCGAHFFIRDNRIDWVD